jgi:hypothetical protein
MLHLYLWAEHGSLFVTEVKKVSNAILSCLHASLRGGAGVGGDEIAVLGELADERIDLTQRQDATRTAL